MSWVAVALFGAHSSTIAAGTYPPVVEVTITNRDAANATFTVRHYAEQWEGPIRLPITSASVAAEPFAPVPNPTITWHVNGKVIDVKRSIDSTTIKPEEGKDAKPARHTLVVEPDGANGKGSVELIYTLSLPNVWSKAYRVLSSQHASRAWRVEEVSRFRNATPVPWDSSGNKFRVILQPAIGHPISFLSSQKIESGEEQIESREVVAKADPDSIWFDVSTVREGLINRTLHLHNTLGASEKVGVRHIMSVGPGAIRLLDAPSAVPTNYVPTATLATELPFQYGRPPSDASPGEFWTLPSNQRWLAIGQDADVRVLRIQTANDEAWLPLKVDWEGNSATVTYFVASRLKIEASNSGSDKFIRFYTSGADQQAFVNPSEWKLRAGVSSSVVAWQIAKSSNDLPAMQATKFGSSRAKSQLVVLKQLRDNLEAFNQASFRQRLLPLYASELRSGNPSQTPDEQLEDHFTKMKQYLDAWVPKLARAEEARSRESRHYQEVLRLSQALYDFHNAPNSDELWRQIRRTELTLEEARQRYDRTRKSSFLAERESQWVVNARATNRRIPWVDRERVGADWDNGAFQRWPVEDEAISEELLTPPSEPLPPLDLQDDSPSLPVTDE
ncbi:MAG: hypothetical protein H6822_20340 [Planctomycetaceae bacterium]|nr:hypothetical protein [Planctomycetaceae bacterium]